MKLRAQMDVSSVPLSMTITMTRNEWADIMKQLPTGWPSWKLAQLISHALGEITRATDQTFTGGSTEDTK